MKSEGYFSFLFQTALHCCSTWSPPRPQAIHAGVGITFNTTDL